LFAYRLRLWPKGASGAQAGLDLLAKGRADAGQRRAVQPAARSWPGRGLYPGLGKAPVDLCPGGILERPDKAAGAGDFGFPPIGMAGLGAASPAEPWGVARFF
jgi:hypothetical protein